MPARLARCQHCVKMGGNQNSANLTANWSKPQELTKKEDFMKTTKSDKSPLTTANANEWFETTLQNPSQARELRDTNWVELFNKKFALSKQEAENLSLIPEDCVLDVQKAIRLVIDQGGTIQMKRDAEDSSGEIFIRPNTIGPNVESLSIGIFHCTFDGFFRHWKCGWGPG